MKRIILLKKSIDFYISSMLV